MLYVDNLKHGLNTNPFSLPRCAFLDSNMIDSITSMDRRRDIHSETAEFGNLMVSQLYLKLFVVIMQIYCLQFSVTFSLMFIFFKKMQLKSLTDTCYSVPAALPALAAAHVSAAAGSSAHGPGTSHDPGGPAVGNLQPPPIYRYPSFSSSFGQRIVDVV